MPLNNDSVLTGQLITASGRNDLNDDANNIVDNVHPQYNHTEIDPVQYKTEGDFDSTSTFDLSTKKALTGKLLQDFRKNGDANFETGDYDEERNVLIDAGRGEGQLIRIACNSVFFRRGKASTISVRAWLQGDRNTANGDMKIYAELLRINDLNAFGSTDSFDLLETGTKLVAGTDITEDSNLRDFTLRDSSNAITWDVSNQFEDRILCVMIVHEIDITGSTGATFSMRSRTLEVLRNYPDSN